MKTWHEKTIAVYDNSAQRLAEYFRGIGPRTEDIQRGLALSGATAGTARVVEIGCGDGRDAAEINKLASWYQGFDPSTGLLEIAQRTVPDASFVKADALTYDYPFDIDVYFAFASLLHVNQDDFKTVLDRVYRSLKPGGILYLSLKERPEYIEEVKEDDYGARMFYYYNPELVKQIAGIRYEAVHEDHQTIGKTDWFTLALQKV